MSSRIQKLYINLSYLVICLLLSWSNPTYANLPSLVEQYRTLNANGECSKALKIATNAAEEALSNRHPKELDILRDVVILADSCGKLDSVIGLYLNSLDTLGDTANPQKQRLLHLAVADLYRKNGRYESASEHYLKANISGSDSVDRQIFQQYLASSSLSGDLKMLGSAFDFFSKSHRELEDFGRYTYLLTPLNTEKAGKLVEVILSREISREVSSIDFDRKQLNAFYLPVDSAGRESTRLLSLNVGEDFSAQQITLPILAARYDYEYAYSLMLKFCQSVTSAQLDVCKKDLEARGPFLITTTKTLAQFFDSPNNALITDLTDVHPDAYPKVVGILKNTLKETNKTNQESLKWSGARLMFLSQTLKAADGLSSLINSFAFKNKKP